MKKVERILLIGIGLGLVLKVLDLPLASVLLILAMSTLSTIYLLLGWFLFPTPTSKDQIPALSVLSGVVLSIAAIGILFKIQVWPFSGFYLFISMFSLATLGLVFFLKRPSRPDLGPYITNMLRRLVPALVVVVLLYAVPERLLLDHYYRDQPGKAELIQRLHSAPDRATEEQLIHELDSLERWVWKTGPTGRSPRHRE
jgi:hypothetical protein